MTVDDFVATVLDPGLALLNKVGGIPSDDRARTLLTGIAGQESGITTRLQQSGTARGWLQFEKRGAVSEVTTNARTAKAAASVCKELCIPTDIPTVYEAIAWSDPLSIAFGRLLLWIDPAELPAVGQIEIAWDYYNRLWKPGKPSRTRWTTSYQNAVTAIRKAPASVLSTVTS